MRIREVGPMDYDAFRRMFAELGLPESPPGREDWWLDVAPGSFFLEEGGEPVAYVAAFPRGESGHLLHLVVAPSHRGRGLGRVALEEAARRLRAAGCRRWHLNVKEDNEAALELYLRMGFQRAHSARALRVSEDTLGRLPGGRRIKVGRLAEEDAVAAEARFGVPAGSLLRLPGVGLRADRNGDLCGVSRLILDGARAAPFRVDNEDVVKPLLDAMHRLAPDVPFVRLVIEAEPELADWLCKLGAIEELRLVHLRGELPAE
jgi:ribosomal protein S18 acetylase RimI-like enzyme